MKMSFQYAFSDSVACAQYRIGTSKANKRTNVFGI